MRIDIYKPAKGVPDPKTRTGIILTFTSGHIVNDKNAPDYDIYLVNGVVYVCRGEHVGVFFDHGLCFVAGDEGRKLSSDLAKKWPRPKPADSAASPNS